MGALLYEWVKHFLIELRSSNEELYVESDIGGFLINKFYLDYWEEFDWKSNKNYMNQLLNL